MRIAIILLVAIALTGGNLRAQSGASTSVQASSLNFDGLYYEQETEGMIGAIRFFHDGTVLLLNKPYLYGENEIPQNRGAGGRYELAPGQHTIRFTSGFIEYRESIEDYVGNRCLALELIAPGKMKMTYEFLHSKPNYRMYKTFAFRSDADVAEDYKRQWNKHLAQANTDHQKIENQKKADDLSEKQQAERIQNEKEHTKFLQDIIAIVIFLFALITMSTAVVVRRVMIEQGNSIASIHITDSIHCRLCAMDETQISATCIPTTAFKSPYILPSRNIRAPVLVKSAGEMFTVAACATGFPGGLIVALLGLALGDEGSTVRNGAYFAAVIYVVSVFYLFWCELYKRFNKRFPFYYEHLRRQNIAYPLWSKSRVGLAYFAALEEAREAEQRGY